MSKESKEILVAEPYVIGMLGAIGSGKSTLSKVLSDSLDIKRIEENFPLNPFLKGFYDSPKEYSFRSQLWFLKSTVDQMMDTPELHSKKEVILDPANEMNYLFAKTHLDMGWMSKDEFEIYESLYKILRDKSGIKKPDVYIAMSAGIDLLMARILGRGRSFETKMLQENPGYLVKLNSNIVRFAAKNKNVIFVDSEFDHKNSPMVEKIIGQIRDKVKP